MATIDDVYALLQAVETKVDAMQTDIAAIKLDTAALITKVDYTENLAIMLKNEIENNIALTNTTDTKVSSLLFEIRKRR